MNKTELKKNAGKTMAVIFGTMYDGATANPVEVLEIGVPYTSTTYSGRYGLSVSHNTTNSGVKVVRLDSKTMKPAKNRDGEDDVKVIASRQIVGTWEDYTAIELARATRRANTRRTMENASAAIEDWAARLDIETYKLPALSAGGRGAWDENIIASNRTRLVALIEAAYELGKAEATK